MSQFQWAIARRSLFVLLLAWGFGALSWAMVPIPDIAATIVWIAICAAYVYSLTKWKMPKSPFSDNTAHASHLSNIMLKETLLSAIVAVPPLLGLAWISYQIA